MHEYYRKTLPKLKKDAQSLMKHISGELTAETEKTYPEIFDEIWDCYVSDFVERFPFIGGDKVSGTRNLTGSFVFAAMGEVLKRYGVSLDRIGHLMHLSYERYTLAMPAIARWIMGKLFTNPKLLNMMFKKKDATNAANAVKYPGGFETKVQTPTAEYPFIYHNLVCPLSNFARQYGYEEYMPYICNMDYTMYGALGVPLFRTHTVFADGDCCNFSVKPGAKPMEAWPPVFSQGKGYK